MEGTTCVPAARRLVLTDDPLEAIANNDRHRLSRGASVDPAPAEPAELWTADDLATCNPGPYKFRAPTFAPRPWPMSTPVSQADYDRRFAAEFGTIHSILPIPNVCVAGGAAALPFTESYMKAGDVDIFIWGISDRTLLWKKVDEVARKIRIAYMGAGGGVAATIAETMTPGLVTFAIRYGPSGGRPAVKHKVQIILRAFIDIPNILYGFDVPSCCVAYDGVSTVMTYLAAWSHAWRANIVNPNYRSLTYEVRLEKYHSRGYALVLPNLRPGALEKGTPLQLPHLTLVPTVVRGPFAVGTISLPAGAPASSSDYDPIGARVWSISLTVGWAPAQINIQQLANGRGRYIVMGLTENNPRRQWQSDPTTSGIPYASYVNAEPCLHDIIPRSEFTRIVDQSTRSAVNRRGIVNNVVLRNLFGLTVAELSGFTSAAALAAAQNPGRRIDMSPSLARFRNALFAAYEEAPAAIDWWIVVDPSRQHTASRDPRIEDPEVWYGDAYVAEAKPPSNEDYIEALLGMVEGRQPVANDHSVFDGTCPLCFEPLVRGAINSVILPCGHIFHWSEVSGGCSGLHIWSIEHHNCPTCRRPFAGGSEVTTSSRQEEVVLINIVSWDGAVPGASPGAVPSAAPSASPGAEPSASPGAEPSAEPSASPGALIAW